MARTLTNIGYEDQYDPDPRRRALLDQMPDPQAGSTGAVTAPSSPTAPRAPSTGPLPPSAPPPNMTYPEQRPSGITPVETPTAAPATPAGWDQTKWADPTHQTTKYEVGRILAKYPPTTAGLQQAWAEIQAKFPGASFNNKDTISGLPGTMGPVDVLRNASTGGDAWRWGDMGGEAAERAAAPGVPVGNDTRAIDLGGVNYDPRQGYRFGYTGGQLPTELANFYTIQTQTIQRQQQEQAQIQATMRDALLRMMAQGQEPVDMTNDPGAATYRNAARREQRQGRDALAERAAFLGLNSGGQGSGSFESAIEGQEQDVRRDIAGYEANRATTELQNRRGLLVQALQMAQALGARTEATGLQRELAQLDAQLRQQQLGFNYAGLGQQQGQFEDSMGFNYANLLANLNRGSYLDLME